MNEFLKESCAILCCIKSCAEEIRGKDRVGMEGIAERSTKSATMQHLQHLEIPSLATSKDKENKRQ